MKKFLFVVLAAAIAATAAAGQDDVIKSLLPGSDLKPVIFRMTAEEITAVQSALGCKLPVSGEHEIYSSKEGAVVVTEQLGKWGMIKFAILIDPAGKTVKKIAVISMNEKRGRAITWPNFLGQFTGKGTADLAGFDCIKAVSGATVSSKAVFLAAKKALLIYGLMAGSDKGGKS